MYNPRSLAVRSSEHFATLVQSVITRLHRKHDARFQLLDEALSVLEARSSAVFPTIRKVTLSQGSPASARTALDLSDAAAQPTSIVVTGLNFTTDETLISATLGSVSMAVSPGATATSITLTIPAAGLSGLTAGDYAVFALRVDGVLCSTVNFPVVA
jgi:hypothetical protein